MKFVVTAATIIDLASANGVLEKEDSIMSAVIISLLTDRRAKLDDVLPTIRRASAIGDDRKGWVGDSLSDDFQYLIGSRLWLLQRAKQTEETRKNAIFYCKEALQWMLDDGVASAIDVEAEWTQIGRLDAKIGIYLIEGGLFSFALQDVTGDISAI